MRFSRLFGKTLRQAPAEAETPSHQLLLRAGMIQQLAAGIYTFLPLGWRAFRKVEAIIRQEMDAAGAQEVLMPALQPLELWEESGRAQAFGPTLFRLQDRRERWLCLAPTHEEVVTGLVRSQARSYRDLPLNLYQIQTKFRDEPRPRGGLVRVREFFMKDAYSFDCDAEGLDRSYDAMYRAYQRIFARCGIPALPVEADSGAIGGKDSVEFMLLAESGENDVVYCAGCGYAANGEKAEAVKPAGPAGEPLPAEAVDTPGCTSIEEVARFMGVSRSQTLKAVFYVADGEPVFVVVRGDFDVNDVKLRNTLGASELRLADEREVRAAGLVAGAASPVGLSGIRVVGDDSITLGANFVAGANRPETHIKHVNYPRDFQVSLLADIATIREGDPCRRCGAPLRMAHGVELGHVFKLGTVYSEKLGAEFLDPQGARRPMVMGCYGIGVGRLLAAVVEHNRDERGILWPSTVAPYELHLCALTGDDPAVAEEADQLYGRLTERGFEVLYDDRDESPGVKFNDADLIGLPVRLTVSRRTVRAGAVEVKPRRADAPEMVTPEELERVIRAALPSG